MLYVGCVRVCMRGLGRSVAWALFSSVRSGMVAKIFGGFFYWCSRGNKVEVDLKQGRTTLKAVRVTFSILAARLLCISQLFNR